MRHTLELLPQFFKVLVAFLLDYLVLNDPGIVLQHKDLSHGHLLELLQLKVFRGMLFLVHSQSPIHILLLGRMTGLLMHLLQDLLGVLLTSL